MYRTGRYLLLAVGAAVAVGNGYRQLEAWAATPLETVTLVQVVTNYDEAGQPISTETNLRHIRGLDSVVETTDEAGVAHIYYDLNQEGRRVRIHALPEIGIKVTEGATPFDLRSVAVSQTEHCHADNGAKTIHGLEVYGQVSTAEDDESTERRVTTRWLAPAIGCRSLEMRIERVTAEGARHLMRSIEVTAVSQPAGEAFEVNPTLKEVAKGEAYIRHALYADPDLPAGWTVDPMVVKRSQTLDEAYLSNRRRFGLFE